MSVQRTDKNKTRELYKEKTLIKLHNKKKQLNFYCCIYMSSLLLPAKVSKFLKNLRIVWIFVFSACPCMSVECYSFVLSLSLEY